MSLHCLVESTVGVPSVDASVLTTGISSSFCIEDNLSKIGHFPTGPESSLNKQTLGGICWVPELDFLQPHCAESQVVSLLRPSHVYYLIF